MEQKTIKENKIAFILCVNNQMYFDECCAYLDRLSVPDGYEAEVFPVWDSSSMCQAYNIGMNASDAKYKIYMHQDVFITEELFISKIIHIFENNKDIGMIGMVGAECIPSSGVFFNSYNVGKVEVREPDMPYYYVAGKDKEKLMDVQAVDGVLIATQVDIPWREDLFKDYDFYDASQGLEFIKAGYRVVVPAQEKPWIIHDCGFAKLDKYDRNRRIFVENYSEFLTYDSGMEFEYNEEWDGISSQLAKIVEGYINLAEWDKVEDIINEYHRQKYKNTMLERQSIINDIHKNSKNEFDNLWSYKESDTKLCYLKFIMRRVEMGWNDEKVYDFLRQLVDKKIDINVILTAMPHFTIYINRFLDRIIAAMEEGHAEQVDVIRRIREQTKNVGIHIAYGRRYA